MRIDKKLNLVLPIERDDSAFYVHATPLSREVFEKYWLVLSKAFTAIYTEGLNVVAGPRVAALMVKRIAQEMGEWDGVEGVENGLMEEIRRLSNVTVPVEGGGWQTLPLHVAMQRDVFSPDEAAEVEGAITFFIVASAMHKASVLASVLENLCSLWHASTTSLNSTEYANSLPTLTETGSGGETETVSQSSLPS